MAAVLDGDASESDLRGADALVMRALRWALVSTARRSWTFAGGAGRHVDAIARSAPESTRDTGSTCRSSQIRPEG